jgi:hypothetical protein
MFKYIHTKAGRFVFLSLIVGCVLSLALMSGHSHTNAPDYTFHAIGFVLEALALSFVPFFVYLLAWAFYAIVVDFDCQDPICKLLKESVS